MPWITEDHPVTKELNACVQCGLCLPQCPTFRLTGLETASPRGRLHAMSAVAADVIEVDEVFQRIIDFCLGCRACEPVCPGMVPYGKALEGARAEIVAQRPTWGHRLRSFLLGPVLGSSGTLKLGSGAISAAQSIGLVAVAPRRLKRLSGGLRRLRGRPRAVLGYEGKPGTAGRVALLSGCIQDQWFRPVNHAAIRLLEMAGYQVDAPAAQICCGALAAHDGKASEAHRLAARNVTAFAGYDHVVATAAGCSAHLRGYGHWTDGGEELEANARDITVLIAGAIADGRLPTLTSDSGQIAVQDPCHLRHAQRVVSEPRAILSAGGYQPVDIDPNGMCCGAAGLYTVLQPEASQQLGNQKADQVRSTGVTRVASANPGCEMQLRSALGDGFEVAHPIEWYLEAVKRASNVERVEATG